ncbi:glutamyl aminopeptidase isoform X2 [Cephus cinctus]|nr:glutamyl aminopeptidase isoform X2 [Cephus cinctus]
MSTYLLAFIVSDLICSTSSVKSLDGRSIPISIYSKSNDRNKIQLALTVSAKAMQFYGTLFGIDYPLPKIDLVAVPDFAAGAMENWGLITFRESQLFFNENHSSCANMKSVALTISHELAHMWFGNLVTLKWWEDLWLNEGFATYMEHLAVDYIFPEWRQRDAFILDTKYVTMKHDSKISSHPVVHRSENSDEIGEMFDRISYQKGAAIIRMLEDAMGDYKFICGIKNYLKTYMYGNAETCQLFQILQKYFRPDIDVVKFMSSWTNYPGFPVISVHCHGDSLRLTQKRYISGSSENIDSKQSWDIPIKYITSREDSVQFGWFLGNSSCVELALEAPVRWIKLNHQSVGYYIVNYTLDAWKMFSHLLIEDFEILDPLDRADLLHDAFLLADSNDLCYCAVLNLTTYLTNENALQPWTVAANWLHQTDKLLSGTKLYLHFQCYAQTLLDTIYKKVGWKVEKNESMTRRELRVVILKSACTVGHKDCLAVAKTRLKDFIASGGATKPHADLRSIVYSFGLISLGSEAQSIFEKMWHLFLCETDVQEKEKLMIGLASVRDENILNRYLINVTNENIVRRQNFFEIIVKIASNPMGLNIVWDFVRDDWQKLVNKYTLNDFSMGLAVGSIVSLFKDNQKLEEAKIFFTKHPEAGAGSNARRDALEEAANSINWLTSNLPKIQKWMQTNEFTRNVEAKKI